MLAGHLTTKGTCWRPSLRLRRYCKAEGAAPVNLKFCFEGQEEIGSPHIPAFMPPHRERFASDLAVSPGWRAVQRDRADPAHVAARRVRDYRSMCTAHRQTSTPGYTGAESRIQFML